MEQERGKPSKNVRPRFHRLRMANFGSQRSEARIPERDHTNQEDGNKTV